MKKKILFGLGVCFCFSFWLLFGKGIAQDAQTSSSPASQNQEALPKEVEPAQEEKDISASGNVTLDFKEADIQNVLKIISFKSGVNIVTTPDVIGNVTIRLVDVPWETAMEVILKTYGFGYQKQSNIILVTKSENIAKIQSEEPLRTEIITLKFLDAQDAEKIMIPLLSPRGKLAVLYVRGQKGWSFGTFKVGETEKDLGVMQRSAEGATTETYVREKGPSGELVSRTAPFEPTMKSKILVITDTATSLERMHATIDLIDKKPKQVIIEARLMEVNRDKLRDIGFDWGLGSSTSAESNSVSATSISKDNDGRATTKLGGNALGSNFIPSGFGPKELTTAFLGKYPYNAGAQFVFQKLTGTKMEAIVHALEEVAHANTLSAPRIMTLDNQEAAIMVGYFTPIIDSQLSGGTSTDPTKITQTLKYYQAIGITLNAVPQINEDGYINMIIHPRVSSSSSSVPATSYVGSNSTTVNYPVIDVRETQTQILIRDGETIVIGGLIKDVLAKETIGIPFLSNIPFMGGLFRRDVYDTQKIELLMFISARIVKDTDFSPEEIKKLEEDLKNTSKEKVWQVKTTKKKETPSKK